KTDHLASFLIFPDRQRGSPVAVTADGPITRVLQPVAEPPITQMLRHPMRQAIIRHQAVAEGFYPHEPRRHCAINQRRIAAPTEWIAVKNRALMNEFFLSFQLFDNFRVCLFYMQSHKITDWLGKPPLIINWVDHLNAGTLEG